MKNQQQDADEEEEKGGGGGYGGNIAVWDCGSPLYDSFELASLCHLLDRHVMTLPFYRGSGRLAGRPSDEPDEAYGGPIVSRGRRVLVVSGGVVGSSRQWRVGKEKIRRKKSKVGLLGIWTAIAFWRKQ